MTETCTINFLTLVSYPTSIVITGLRRLLLAVLMWAGVDFKKFRAETASCNFGVFFSKFDCQWNKNSKSCSSDFWNTSRSRTPYVVFKLNEKLSKCWRITPLGGAKHANFFKIGNFKHPSLTHWTSHGHQIFIFTNQVGALVERQALARLLRNRGGITS